MGKKLRLSIPAGALALMFFTLGFSLACRQTKENSAEAFDKIARTILKNVYPYLAKQIKDGVEIKAKDLKVAQIHFETNDLIAIKDGYKRILAIARALISSQEIQRAKGEEKAFEYKRVLI